MYLTPPKHDIHMSLEIYLKLKKTGKVKHALNKPKAFHRLQDRFIIVYRMQSLC